MTQPVIVEAVRTPLGKRNGTLAGVHPAQLLGAAQVELIKRTGIDPSEVEQIFGQRAKNFAHRGRFYRARSRGTLRHCGALGTTPTMRPPGSVDAYSESERITAWFTMIKESLGVPFETTVLEVLVAVCIAGAFASAPHQRRRHQPPYQRACRGAK